MKRHEGERGEGEGELRVMAGVEQAEEASECEGDGVGEDVGVWRVMRGEEGGGEVVERKEEA